MARRYSGNKGQSSSHKPLHPKTPVWLKYKSKEIELLISKLAKEGKLSGEIGLILRDKYGIPDVRLVCKKSISEILKESKLGQELPDDLLSLVRRSVAIRKHLEANRQDETAKRGLMLTESKIKRLVKYYKAKQVLAEDWKFDPDRAGFYLK